MKFQLSILAAALGLVSASAQLHGPVKSEAGGVRSGLMVSGPAGNSGPVSDEQKWASTVRPTFSRQHLSPEVGAIKADKLEQKLASRLIRPNPEGGSRVVTPVIGQDMEGNWSVVGTPPDNSMAISNAGFIVTANNDGVEYHNAQGQFLYVDYWADFINNPSLTGIIYDPKVIYDSVSDRFVMVVLHGSTATSSKVMVCFSKTNNPLTGDGWFIYDFNGNPLANNCWTDYPALGISAEEVYITGNLFTSGGNTFNQAVIWQMNKSQGYNGAPISFDIWSNLNAAPYPAFTLQPATHGQGSNFGPGIYFVSNASGGHNKIRLWHLDDYLDNSPQLTVQTVNTATYTPAAPALQFGTSDMLDNGDCRIMNAFYLNGIIHFVFCSDIGSGWNGINYNRLTVSNATIQSELLGAQGTADYCYPAVASFATSATDKSVMIGFLRATESTFPEVRVVNCDNQMDYSATVQVKAGEAYVNFLAGDTERWGDYTGISRRHNSSDPRIWLAGSYGANISGSPNTWKTWLAEVFAEGQPGQVPVTDFSATPTSGTAPLFVSFTDISTNTPSSWNWVFTGGSPAVSTEQSPTVTYNAPGTYNVSLTSGNAFGEDTELKNAYITVSSGGVAPVSDFIGNPTFGGAPLLVNYTDLSTNSPTSRSWSFPGGSPNSSMALSPTVTYSSPGLYTVTLTAENGFGSDTETKTNYVQVNQPIGIDEQTDQEFVVQISPNPVTDWMQVLFDADGGELVTIEILDINGRSVKLLYRDVPKQGENRLTFNRAALTQGTYIVRVRTETKIIKNEKVVIAE